MIAKSIIFLKFERYILVFVSRDSIGDPETICVLDAILVIDRGTLLLTFRGAKYRRDNKNERELVV